MWPKIVFLFLLFPLSLSASNSTQRKKLNLTLSFHTSSADVETRETDQTIANNQSLTVSSLRPSLDYFVTRKLALTASYFLPFGLKSGVEVSGYSLGIRYFLLGSAYQLEANFLGKQINTTAKWGLSAALSFLNESFKFTNSSISFSGLIGELNVNYRVFKDYYLNTGIGLSMASNNNVRDLTGINFSVGLTKSF